MPEEDPHPAFGRTLALVLWGKGASGEDDVAVFSGTLVELEGASYLQRDSGKVPLEVEWLQRIASVPDDLRDTLLGCEYQLSLTVGDVDDEESESWKRMGLTWPT